MRIKWILMRNAQNTLNAKLVFNSYSCYCLCCFYYYWYMSTNRAEIKWKEKIPVFHIWIWSDTLATKCVSIFLIPNNSPAFFGHQLGVLQFNSVLSLPGDRLRTQSHITAHHFRCQSPVQSVTCASHWLAISGRFSQTPPQAWYFVRMVYTTQKTVYLLACMSMIKRHNPGTAG